METTENQNEVQSSSRGRPKRSIEGRAFEGRVTETRKPLVYSNGSRFNVPKEVRDSDPDHYYSFIVYSSQNEELRENFYEAVDMGYMCVRGSDHPILTRRYDLSPFEKKAEDDVIKRGGQILMKIARENHDEQMKAYNEQNHRQEYMAEMHRSRDPRQPRPFMDERKKVSFGFG